MGECCTAAHQNTLGERNLYIKHAAEDGRHREYLGKQSY